FLFSLPAPTEVSTLSLHDALPISSRVSAIQCPRYRSTKVSRQAQWRTEPCSVEKSRRSSERSADFKRPPFPRRGCPGLRLILRLDRKSTRLNSSHVKISYAVFCLK